MNLAKALILLHTPTFVDRNLTHGITQRSALGSLKKQKIIIHATGVFPQFYELVTGHQLTNNSTLKITDLLGYASDVEYEYQRLKYGTDRSFRCRLAIAINNDTKMAFAILAVPGAGRKSFEATQAQIRKHFEQVEIAEPAADKIFDMGWRQRASTHFYESKIEYPWPTNADQFIQDTIKAFDGCASFGPFNDGYQIVLNKKIRTPTLAPMNETIATYCCMFF